MSDKPKHLTIRDLRRLYEAGEKIVALTAYDSTMAGLMDGGAVHVVLVGDSLGMTMLGYANTLPVTLEQSLHHTAAVARVVRRAMVVGDMPFMSYHVNDDEAVRNAGRYLQEAGASAVKLEGGAEIVPTVKRLVHCGIPVMGHVGLLPQHVVAEGGYRLHGKTEREADSIIADAVAIAEAGAFAMVIEGVTAELGRRITEAVRVPTIGIGAGPHTSGQIQVVHDILGLSDDFKPRHAKRYAELASEIRRVVEAYSREVGSGEFPGPENYR
jgi:3-methyl-2-oxobutanoate hydroxymethyltransferase